MAVTIKPYTIEGTGANLGYLQGQVATGFYASGLDPNLTQSLHLDAVYMALQANGYFFGAANPSFPGMALRRIQMEPMGNSQYRGSLIYETVYPDFAFQTAYIIEKSSTIQQFTTTFIPGSKEPITVGFKPKVVAGGQFLGDATPSFPGDPIPTDYVHMTLIRPMRRISVTQIIVGTPPENGDGFVGFLNTDNWQYRYPAYWMLTDYNSTINRGSGFYTVTATALTKNTEDWSEFGVLQNSITGRYAPIDKAEVQTTLNKPYIFPATLAGTKLFGKPGPTLPFTPGDPAPTFSKSSVYQGNGFVRACPYPGVSFTKLFGFQ